MNQVDCPCKRTDCPQHGDCEACRAHHQGSRRSRPCERKGGKAVDSTPSLRRRERRRER